MQNPYKKITASLLLFSHMLTSCYNPNIGMGKQALPPPADPADKQGQYAGEPHDKYPPKPTNLIFTTADKHPITFTYHNGLWQAEVEEHAANGSWERRQLPVVFEPGLRLEDVVDSNPIEQKQLLHLCPSEEEPDQPGYVYVGREPSQAKPHHQLLSSLAARQTTPRNEVGLTQQQATTQQQPKQPSRSAIHSKHQQAKQPQQRKTSLQQAQEQPGPQAVLALPSPVQQIGEGPRSQDRLPTTPARVISNSLSIPSRETPGQRLGKKQPTSAPQTPSRRALSLRNQHELLHSQRAAQAKRAQSAAMAKPDNELAQLAQSRQAIVATPTHPPSPADKTPLGIASQVLLAQGGHQVRFMRRDGQWWASVRERIGVFSRVMLLPVACEGHGDVEKALADLLAKPTRYTQCRIHVMHTKQIPYVPKFVYLGEQGLKGGGNGAGKPSGSGEPQDELAAGEPEGAQGREPGQSAPQGSRTSHVSLQERIAQGDITSPAALVDSLNNAHPEEQEVLQQWIQKYIEWFDDQSVRKLTLTPAALQEYTCLAHIQAHKSGNKQLLKNYFYSLCDKIQKNRYGDTPLIEALEYTLQTMDSHVFDGNPAPLVQVGNKLLAKLNAGSNAFTKATYPTYRSTLYALHQALMLIQQITPGQLDPAQKDGLYSRFKAKIQAISASTAYYPIRHHALLLEQSLQRLEEDHSRLQGNLRRVGHGLEGMIYLYQGVRALADLDFDLGAFKSGYESLKEAFTRQGIEAKAWYDRHQFMHYASLLSLKDPAQYQDFEACLQILKDKDATMGKEKDRTALRFGIVQQLRMLALGGPTQQVRKKSTQWLEDLAKPAAWGGDKDVMEGLLDGLADIAVYSQGAEKEQAKEALDSLTHGPGLRRRGKYLSWRTNRLAAQSTIIQWLGNCSTIDDKLSTLPALAAAPDSSESLFRAINSLLREEAPQEHDVRRQLTTVLGLSPPVSFFVGRTQELKAFRQSFQAHQERIIAPPITGPGGIGKTQLALRVVKQQVEETPYDHVFWIPAESAQKLLEAYLRIAESLGIYIDKKDLKQAAQTVRTHLQDRHCLYVFDDAPDIKAIQDFLPLGQGHVLITSRNGHVGAWPTKPLLMNPFGEQEALALAKEFGYGQSSQEQEAFHFLLKQVPCYPLTLVQLFSTLQAERLEAAAFLEAMQQYAGTEKKEQALITLLGERPHERVDYAQSMVYVLKASLERLSKEQLHGEKALQLISQLAYLDPKGIPVDWLLTWDTEDASLLKRKTRAVLSLLEKYSLIQWDKADKQVYLHAETQLMVRHLHPQDSLTALVNSFVDYVGDEEEASQNPAQWSSLLPQARMLFERLTTPQYPQEAYVLTQYLEKACDVGCLFKESVTWAEKRLQIAKQRYPAQDHPDIATSLSNVGVSFAALGQEKEALAYKKQSLEMYKRLYPAQDHPYIAASFNNVGISLDALGQEKEALAYKKQSLEMYKRLYPAQDHPDIATSLSNVGVSFAALGQEKEALAYYKQSLEMYKRLYPTQDHPDIAASFNNVGVSFAALGQEKEALAYKKQSLEMYKRLYPAQDHPDTAASFNNVGVSFAALGQEKEALAYKKQSLEMYKRLYPAQDHPYIAASLNNVGMSFAALGQEKEALAYYKQSLEMYKRLYAPQDYPDIALSLNNVGYTLGALGEEKEALAYFKQSLEMYKRLYAAQDHPDIATSLNNVGYTLGALGEEKEALAYKKQSLEMYKRLYAPQDHPDIALSLNNVGYSLGALGEEKEALAYKKQSLEMYKRLYAPQDHPDIALSLNNVGSSLGALGQEKDALAYYKQSLEMRQRLYAAQDHPDIALSLNNVGSGLGALGKEKDALAYYKQSLEMYKRLYAPQDHPDIAASLNNVGYSLGALGEEKEALAYKKQSLEMYKRLYAPQDHPDIALSLNNVGMSFVALGEEEEALAYFKQSLEMYKRLYPAQDHPYIAASLNNVGMSFATLGEEKEALAYKKQALCRALHIYQKEHPDITQYLNNLIANLSKVEDQALIQQTKDEVVPLCNQWLGKAHELTQQLRHAGK